MIEQEREVVTKIMKIMMKYGNNSEYPLANFLNLLSNVYSAAIMTAAQNAFGIKQNTPNYIAIYKEINSDVADLIGAHRVILKGTTNNDK